MARSRGDYRCRECGKRFVRWSGRCSNCGEWNSLERAAPPEEQPYGRRARSEPRAYELSEVPQAADARLSTGLGEFDRVLGGGLLPGSTVLLGGEPGIGKSTIMLQALAHLAARGCPCIYVACEESPSQVKLRADRLGLQGSGLVVSPETELESVCALLEREEPRVVAVDSIQMVNAGALDSPVGSLRQLKTCGGELTKLARARGAALFLVGHVTKQGAIAGPRALEHLVDTVLYFESEQFQARRILRAVKNRFGSVNEIGVFAMGGDGLREVADPSRAFLAERQQAAAGSVVTGTVEGSRALLVEIQALVSPGAYGTPERRVSGADRRRVSMMMAVLQRRTGLNLDGCDTFVNVAGGVRVVEPAADLPLAAAIASGFRDRPFPADTMAVGEVGLGGEVRAVGRIDERLKEAEKLGFSRAVVPRKNCRDAEPTGLQLQPVGHLREVLEFLEVRKE